MDLAVASGMKRALTRQLQLDDAGNVDSMKSSYRFLMDVSDRVREFSPLSTNFVKKDLGKVHHFFLAPGQAHLFERGLNRKFPDICNSTVHLIFAFA
jgi:hypothetical protein